MPMLEEALAIAHGIKALQRLSQGEDAAVRDDLAWVSPLRRTCIGQAGLGAGLGLAGPIGRMSPAAHGAV